MPPRAKRVLAAPKVNNLRFDSLKDLDLALGPCERGLGLFIAFTIDELCCSLSIHLRRCFFDLQRGLFLEPLSQYTSRRYRREQCNRTWLRD